MGQPRTPRRSLALRATILAAWVHAWPWWAALAAPALLLGGLAALWAFTPRLTPPGVILAPLVWFIEDDAEGIRLVPAWQPGSTAIAVDIRKNWPSRQWLGVPVLVRDIQTILWHDVGFHGDIFSANPRVPSFQPNSRLAERVAALATLLQESNPAAARLLRTPEYSRRHIHWPGVAHLALATSRLLAACLLLAGLLFMAATWLGLGHAATLRRLALEGHCLRCGYDLIGLKGLPCPECGSTDSAHQFASTTSVVPAIAESYEHA